MEKSLNYTEKLAYIASKHIFSKSEEEVSQARENYYVFGPVGMIVLQ